MSRLHRLRRDESGMAFVFIGLGLMAFLAASMLAIDVGMLMTARNQAQNSADAGALAGAVALVFDDYNDRTTTGPAVQSALAAARSNTVMRGAVSVTPADVEFLADSFGEQNRVRVTVFRRAERGNPVSTLVAAYFGIRTADIAATATAEAAPANAATCVKPWAVPDKWNEVGTPPWDENDTFDMFDNRGNPIPNPDIYIPVTQSGYTGYRSDRLGPDYGRQVLLKPGNPNQSISSSHFFPIALPPDSGAAWYEENIPNCYNGILQIGNDVPVEPGNMTGPTVSGTQQLIDADPAARWDPVGRKIVGSTHSPSPRIVVIPVFDPIAYEISRQHGRLEIKIANLVGFFIEDLRGNDVLGRIVPMTGLIRGGTPPGGAFLKAIRLVE